MAKEYIERYAAIAALLAKLDERKHAEFLFGDEIDTIIRNIPAADVVEVVLCRKCQSYNKPRLGFCETHLVRTHGDDFCSYGKKREES